MLIGPCPGSSRRQIIVVPRPSLGIFLFKHLIPVLFWSQRSSLFIIPHRFEALYYSELSTAMEVLKVHQPSLLPSSKSRHCRLYIQSPHRKEPLFSSAKPLRPYPYSRTKTVTIMSEPAPRRRRSRGTGQRTRTGCITCK